MSTATLGNDEFGDSVNTDQPENSTIKIYNLLQLIDECEDRSVLLPDFQNK